ncbi:MAG: aldo/keto reductase [Spirochaetales bacterium]|nr:aldo/keto reductase [Spirochaetales bacterium]
MKMIQFADTNEQVSNMALGALPFGSKLDRAQSFTLLDYYQEQGGNFIDTANNYSFWDAGGTGGESETILGQWCKERQARDSVFLATKLGAFPTVSRSDFFNYPGNPWADCTEGLSRKTILSSVDQSLKRLGTDHIDLLYAHVDDYTVDQEETLEAFNQIIQSGKARYIGCSNFKVWRMARAREISKQNQWFEYKAVQMFHTYFQSEKGADTGMADQMGEELFSYVREGNNVSLLGYTPLLWGSYTEAHKYQEIERLAVFVRPQNEERRKCLELVASQTGWTINQVIYAWMINSTPSVIPLVAVSKIDHLKEDLAASLYVLSKDQMNILNAPTN